MKKLNYIQGAFILTITNLITGVLSFIYRIFLSRSIGSEGVGVFQLVLPLYTLAITLVSGGIATAVSKLIAEQYAKQNLKNIHKIIKICSIVVGVWSFALCLLLALNASFFAKNILKDIRTLYSIIIFTPAVFFIAISSVLKGYFFGLQDVKPPAYIDILEKTIRLSALIITAYILIPYGIIYVCAGAMLAMTAGEFISMMLLMLVYRTRIKSNKKDTATDSTMSIITRILKTAIPLSITGALSTIMDMFCAIIVPAQLRISGYENSRALAQYGELTGMAMPLLFFPAIIIFSLSITLVPAITASYTARNWTALNKKCNDSLKITSVISLGATALFIIFPSELCNIFFKCAHAGNLLFWMSFSCIFIYWEFSLFAILNGLGLQNKVLKNSMIGIVITVLCAYILIPLPSIGIYGYIIGFNFSAAIVVILNMQTLIKLHKIYIDYSNILVKPLVCFSFMLVFTKYCNIYLSSLGATKINMTLSSALGLMLFFILLIITRTFSLKQIKNTMFVK